MKIFYILMIILLLISCSGNKVTESDDNSGVIAERPKIPVSVETQISLTADTVLQEQIDINQKFSQDINDSLDCYLDEILVKGGYTGLSAAVGVPGQGFWSGVSGESGTATPLSPNTKIHAFSLAKMFTAALTLKLAEEGLINLNSTIDNWFPDYPESDIITINHLLTHTSGIQTHDALKEFVSTHNQFSEEEIINITAEYDLNFTPGTFFSYCNTSYVMLGLIIQRTLNCNLEQAFQDYLINPLHLTNTYVLTPENTDMGEIRGFHNHEVSATDEWILTFGAGPIITTPTEIVQLYNYLFSGDFLATESISLMLENMNLWLMNPDGYYGKGIYVITGVPSGSYLGHSGGYNCFRTSVFYNIEHHVVVSVFSNSDDTEIEPAMFSLAEKLIDLINE